MRSVSLRVALTAVVASLASGIALADTGSLPNGATITFYQEFLFEVANPATHGGVDPAQPLKVPNSLWTYFNYAHCVCDEPQNRTFDTTGIDVSDPNHRETTFGWKLTEQQGSPPDHLPLLIYTGDMCDTTDLPTRGSNCSQLDYAGIADLNSIYPSGATPYIHIFDLMTPEPALNAAGQCQQRVLAANEWLAVSTMQDGNLDFWQSQEIDTDSLPPPVPTVVRMSSGDGAINLSWDPSSTGDLTDIYYYQALCVDPNGKPARSQASSSRT